MLVHEAREHHVLGAKLQEYPVELLVVVDVLLALLALDPVERGLGDVDIAPVQEAPHLPVEEREEERPDVRAVHVGVGHDDHLVVARLLHVEGALALGVADAGADGRYEGADFLVGEHLVEAGLLGVDQLSAGGGGSPGSGGPGPAWRTHPRSRPRRCRARRARGRAPSSRQACRAGPRRRGRPCARSRGPCGPPRAPGPRSESCR